MGEALIAKFVWILSSTQQTLTAQIWHLSLVVLSGTTIVVVAELMVRERRDKIAQRDMLIREINHRIANHIQTILAMLAVQARQSSNAETRDALALTSTRISGISEIHEKFSRGSESDEIDIKDYLETLCAGFADGLVEPGSILISVDTPPLILSKEYALGAGMIVHELMMNAAKHAFTDGRAHGAKSIHVALTHDDDEIRISVKDNGIGLPADYATRRRGLGKAIIENFVHRMNGRLDIANDKGTVFTIIVPKPRPKSKRPALFERLGLVPD